MNEHIMVVDSSRILDGKLEAVKATARELAEFVEAKEARPIAYEIYLDEDETTFTVVQIHPDSASMELHMEMAAPIFARFAPLLQLLTIDIFGRPSDKLIDQLRRKAEMLGGAPAALHHLEAGFARIRTS